MGLDRIALDGILAGPLLVSGGEGLGPVVVERLGQSELADEAVVAVRDIPSERSALRGENVADEWQIARSDTVLGGLLLEVE